MISTCEILTRAKELKNFDFIGDCGLDSTGCRLVWLDVKEFKAKGLSISAYRLKMSLRLNGKELTGTAYNGSIIFHWMV